MVGKFRVWDKVMFYSGIIDDPSERYYIAQDGTVWCGLEQIEGVVVMMSTGLLDKTGKEIYEGDILEFDADIWGNDTDNKWVVKWDRFHGSWHTGGGVTSECGTHKSVIGNVHENPDWFRWCHE